MKNKKKIIISIVIIFTAGAIIYKSGIFGGNFNPMAILACDRVEGQSWNHDTNTCMKDADRKIWEQFTATYTYIPETTPPLSPDEQPTLSTIGIPDPTVPEFSDRLIGSLIILGVSLIMGMGLYLGGRRR